MEKRFLKKKEEEAELKNQKWFINNGKTILKPRDADETRPKDQWHFFCFKFLAYAFQFNQIQMEVERDFSA